MTVRKHDGKTVFGLYTKYALEDNVIECLDELCKMVDKRDEMISNANKELLKRGCRISELGQKVERLEYNYALRKLDSINQTSVLKNELRVCNDNYAEAESAKTARGHVIESLKLDVQAWTGRAFKDGDRVSELEEELKCYRIENRELQELCDDYDSRLNRSESSLANSKSQFSDVIKAKDCELVKLTEELECIRRAKDKTDAENTRLCALDKNAMHRKYEELLERYCNIRRYSEKQTKHINELKDAICEKMHMPSDTITVTLHDS
ncbi:MAG: hypothetical protein KAJ03_10745 [Gammaproteobacteria bacterium]|nr:hypothetical protein [Gammaproteobacteria bacterium]